MTFRGLRYPPLLALFSAALAWPLSSAAQDGVAGPGEQRGQWNAPRVMALVEQARELRSATAVDSAFQNYAADARGFVYFFLDRPDEDERTLVKTDQIALEVYWQAPNSTRQRIVGLRDRKELPTTIQYHLDHLTVVQDDFGDLIRLGDGDEVGAVVHPVAPRSERLYDFRLVDSLTIDMQGGPTPRIRVYEVEVRPRDFEQPGFVGRISLQQGTGAIVRMRFTFTPASYVDENLDYIRISIDNLAWDGRFWLPYRQEAELRRELPVLDFLAGSVIRGRFEIRRYRVNEDLPAGLFRGRRVTTVPRQAREAFPFEEAIDARIQEEGLGAIADLDEIRDQAYETVGRRYLSGLSPQRLYVPNVSSVYRASRAEGSFVGAGLSFQPTEKSRIKVLGGWSFGQDRPSASVEIARHPATRGFFARGWLYDPVDVGPFQGVSRSMNTLAWLFDEEDYLDLWFRSGGSVGWMFGNPSSGLTVEAGYEEVDSDTFDEVEDFFSAFSYQRRAVRWNATASVRTGRYQDTDVHRNYLSVLGSAQYAQRWTESGWGARADLHVGAQTDDTPAHRVFLLGGRGTLLGHRYRGFAGRAFVMSQLEGSREVIFPWLTVHGFAGAAASYMPEDSFFVPRLATSTSGIAASVGAGFSLGWDVLRFDLGRGVTNGGEWEFTFSANARFWPWL